MKKILLVIRREYTTRIRKVSFWVFAFLIPLLVVGLYSLPLLISGRAMQHTRVLVVDETGVFASQFKSSQYIAYQEMGGLEFAREVMDSLPENACLLYIPGRETTIPTDAFLYYKADLPSEEVRLDIDVQLQTLLRNNILLDVHGISADDYYQLTHTKIHLIMKDFDTGRNDFLQVKIVLGVFLALLICVVVAAFGSQVMRGVTEEKHNRIVEVLLCSLKPFQLMTGKVVGIALLGLTQFVLWVALTVAGVSGIRACYADEFARIEQVQHSHQLATKGTEAVSQLSVSETENTVSELLEGITNINFALIAGMFLVYFVLGYLLYAAIFAAAGAMADEDTDTQQFTIPLTIPLLVVLLCIPAILDAPSGGLSQWLSIIPFTAPVAMMVRVPFGVSMWQVALSVGLLVATVVVCVWVAARIYRKSILAGGYRLKTKKSGER